MEGLDVLRFFQTSCRRDGYRRATSVSLDSETPWRSVQSPQDRYISEYLVPRAMQMMPAEWERSQERESPQEELCHHRRDHGRNHEPQHGRSDSLITRSSAQNKVSVVYSGVKLPEPFIIKCQSPRQVMVLPAMLEIWQRLIASTVLTPLASTPFNYSMRSTVLEKLSDARRDIGRHLDACFTAQPWSAAWHLLRDQLSDEAAATLDDILWRDFEMKGYVLQIGFPLTLSRQGETLNIVRHRSTPSFEWFLSQESKVGPRAPNCAETPATNCAETPSTHSAETPSPPVRWPLNKRFLSETECISAQLLDQLNSYITAAPELFSFPSETGANTMASATPRDALNIRQMIERTASGIFVMGGDDYGSAPDVSIAEVRQATRLKLQTVMRRMIHAMRWKCSLSEDEDALAAAADDAGGFCYVFLERFCFISDPPTDVSVDGQLRLHNASGPALKFADGYAVYALHGATTNPHIIEKTRCPMMSLGEQEKVQPLIQLCLRRFESLEHFSDCCTVKISEDECGVLYERAGVGRFVRVEDATVGVDGSRKVYVLAVPPETCTAREGVAWTFQMSVDQYQPLLQT